MKCKKWSNVKLNALKHDASTQKREITFKVESSFFLKIGLALSVKINNVNRQKRAPVSLALLQFRQFAKKSCLLVLGLGSERGMIEDLALIIWLLIFCAVLFSPILLAFGILYFEIIVSIVYRCCKRLSLRFTPFDKNVSPNKTCLLHQNS